MSSGFGDLSRYFSNHERVVLDLQSANATLTERVGDLESSHNSWQDIHSRVSALESVSTLQQQRLGTQLGPPVTMKVLEPRILKLEDAIAGLDDTSVGEHIKRLERMMENEKRERRARVDTLQKQIKSLANDVAVLMSENEGLRERLNKLTGQVRNLRG
jgi:chromosome segregation ATPase